MEPLSQSLVVGVSGEGENVEALQFAAEEARLRGVGVTLVHVVHHPRREGSPGSSDSWARAGERVLQEAGARLQPFAGGDVPTTTVVRQGNPGSVLAELSKGATAVVLQHRDHSRMHRITTGSTVSSVAAHAESPVISVPPTHHRPSRGLVTVGVHEDGGPADVLDMAFAEAALHEWAVRMVYAWSVPSAYGDMVAEEGHWTAEAKESIGLAVEGLKEKYPGVAVTVEVRHERPADVLTRMSTESDLLVVGRHSHHGFLQPRLGSLARSAITHAECPVMVVSL
jgi:nucleotide-binding universal stress UspA family protein